MAYTDKKYRMKYHKPLITICNFQYRSSYSTLLVKGLLSSIDTLPVLLGFLADVEGVIEKVGGGGLSFSLVSWGICICRRLMEVVYLGNTG
jgi:hypothetical protein